MQASTRHQRDGAMPAAAEQAAPSWLRLTVHFRVERPAFGNQLAQPGRQRDVDGYGARRLVDDEAPLRDGYRAMDMQA